ncbi:MAG: 1-acyl-sn-glycerol-3-phosphate acyltransferase [Oscillospiraceae bacterium]|nr:1-acyl-sn-glycerol-3-phosphate acyltransferase [Oscillospiraceae bacterium]
MNRILLMVLRNLVKVPGLYAKLCRYAKNPDRYPEQERWDHIRHILQLAVRSGNLDLQVTGTENIPASGSGFMMYANHQGLFDVVAIAATCPTPLGGVVKKELEGIPFVQQIIDCTKSYPMNREDVRQSLTVIQNVTEEVKSGRNYLIFPEGTRSKNGNVMGEFHGGSFRCAIKAKCPILPVAFVDSFKVLDQKGSGHISVQLHYLPLIPYEEFAGMKATEVAALVKSRIEETILTHTAAE